MTDRREEPATEAGRALLLAANADAELAYRYESLVQAILAIEREAQGEQPAPLDVERDRLQQALERITANAEHIFDGKAVRDWGETLAEAHAALAATSTATQEPTGKCGAEYEPGWACRRDKGHNGNHSRVRFNADEDESLREPSDG